MDDTKRNALVRLDLEPKRRTSWMEREFGLPIPNVLAPIAIPVLAVAAGIGGIIALGKYIVDLIAQIRQRRSQAAADEEAQEELDRIEDALSELNDEVLEAQAEYEAAAAEVQRVAQQIDQRADAIMTLSNLSQQHAARTIRSLQREMEGLIEELADATDEADGLQEEYGELRARLETIVSDLTKSFPDFEVKASPDEPLRALPPPGAHAIYR